MKEKSKTVDEQFFKNLIAGEVSAKTEGHPEQNNVSVKAKKKTASTNKDDAKDYVETFLRKNELTVRHSTYIGAENYQKLAQLTRLTTLLGYGTLSVGGYIDNLLTQHFEEYKDEISQLLNQQIVKLF